MFLGPVMKPGGSWPPLTAFGQVDSSEFLFVECASFTFSDDGLVGYVCSFSGGGFGGVLRSVNYGVAYDPSDTNSPAIVVAGAFSDMEFSSDGTLCYTLNQVGNLIEERVNSGTPFKPGVGEIGVINDTHPTIGIPWGLHMKADGTRFWYCTAGQTIREVNMSTPWDLTSAVNGAIIDLGPQRLSYQVRISPDGKTAYLQQSSYMREYALSTPFDITTMVEVPGNALQSQAGGAGGGSLGFDVSPDTETLIIQTQWGNNPANNDSLRFLNTTNKSIPEFLGEPYTIVDTITGPSTTRAEIELQLDGNIQEFLTGSNSSIGTWKDVLIVANPAGYQFFLETVTGTLSAIGGNDAADVWVQASGIPRWGVEVIAGSTVKTFTGVLHIRAANPPNPVGDITVSGIITLTADST